MEGFTSSLIEKSGVDERVKGDNSSHANIPLGRQEYVTSTSDEVSQCTTVAIATYLTERVDEFRELSNLRKKGWASPEGDIFFQNQRRNSDRSDVKTAEYFFGMMQRIGNELHRSTGAFSVSVSGHARIAILDLCMAPGGFLKTALKSNPGSRAVGYSLPASKGGHKALLPADPDVVLRFLDITMLAADLGASSIPQEHPDAANFLERHFSSSEVFDIILCDGQVLRTHVRASYREKREARRLTLSQLALGLDHVRPGGTMVVLLHRLELWQVVRLVYRFTRFSLVELFKPTIGHAKRSSFYMVAKNVQSLHEEAILAIEEWKTMWATATFGTDEEYDKAIREENVSTGEVLEDFGPKLIELGRTVWGTQAKALARAPFMKNS